MTICNLKNIFIATALFTFSISQALAASEDWIGAYTVVNNQKQTQTITHTPKNVTFAFFSVGRCLGLGKGSSINGFVVPERVELCVHHNVEHFTKEVSKLGVITEKSIQLGPHYHPNMPTEK